MKRGIVLATLMITILALGAFLAGCNESKSKSGSAGEQTAKETDAKQAVDATKQTAEHPEHPRDATAEHPASSEHAEHPAGEHPAGEHPATEQPTSETGAAAGAGATADAGAATEAGASSSARVVTTASGLKYEDLRLGTGPSPQTGQIAVVHYTGWLTDGTKFDSSVDRGTPFEFPVGQGRVIQGWDEGVATMKVGGKRKLMIPPDLGYGARGAGNVIPPNAELVFDVELLAVK